MYRARNLLSQSHQEHHALLSSQIKTAESLEVQLDWLVRVCLFGDADFAEQYLSEMALLNRRQEDFYYINIRNIFFRVFSDHFPKREFDRFEVLLFHFDNELLANFESTLFLRLGFRNNSKLLVNAKFEEGCFRAQNFLVRLRMLFFRFKLLLRQTLRVRLGLLKVGLADPRG